MGIKIFSRYMNNLVALQSNTRKDSNGDNLGDINLIEQINL